MVYSRALALSIDRAFALLLALIITIQPPNKTQV